MEVLHIIQEYGVCVMIRGVSIEGAGGMCPTTFWWFHSILPQHFFIPSDTPDDNTYSILLGYVQNLHSLCA